MAGSRDAGKPIKIAQCGPAARNIVQIEMARFQIGDRVRRAVSPGTGYVSAGIVVRVIANHHHLQIFDEYEVDFGSNGVLIAFDSQLEAA